MVALNGWEDVKLNQWKTRNKEPKWIFIFLHFHNSFWTTFYLLSFEIACCTQKWSFFIFNLNWKLSWLWRSQIWKSLLSIHSHFHFSFIPFILSSTSFIIHFILECTCAIRMQLRWIFLLLDEVYFRVIEYFFWDVSFFKWNWRVFRKNL